MMHASRIFFTVIIFALCMSLASSDDEYDIDSTTEGTIFNMEQLVEGNGITNTIEKINYLSVYTTSKSHGSGYFKKNSRLESSRNVYFYYPANEYYSSGEQKIKTEKNIDMFYSQCAINFPGSFKAKSSGLLWKEDDIIDQKNLGLSMTLSIDQVKISKKNLSFEIIGTSDSDEAELEDNFSYTTLNGNYSLNLNGRLNLLASWHPLLQDRTKIIEIIRRDESYYGDMKIAGKMNFSIDGSGDSPDVDISELPCDFAINYIPGSYSIFDSEGGFSRHFTNSFLTY